MPVLEAPTVEIHRELIQRCIAKDRAAQSELYGLYSKAMYNTAHRLVNDAELAADVLQDSFLKAFLKMDQYRFEAAFGGWLKRIVVNTALNALKKKKPELLGELDDNLELPEEQEQDFGWPATVEQARAAVQELPDGYRAVFTLYLIEGYDHKEIAEVLGISVSTSLTQYQRAKSKLRNLLLNR